MKNLKIISILVVVLLAFVAASVLIDNESVEGASYSRTIDTGTTTNWTITTDDELKYNYEIEGDSNFSKAMWTLTFNGSNTPGTYSTSVVFYDDRDWESSRDTYTVTVRNASPSVTYYTVSFVSEGHLDPASQRVSSGTQIELPHPGVKEGPGEFFFFNSWFTQATGGTDVGFHGESYRVTSNITLYAQYAVMEFTHTLQYDANGGTGAPSSQTITNKIGSHIFSISEIIPTKEGHTFLGWSTNSTSTTPSYGHGLDQSIRVNDDTRTLFAVWTLVKPNTITFDANGGMAESGAESESVITGNSINLPSSEFTREGHYLAGWTINSKSGQEYDVGEFYIVLSEVTFYAKWNPVLVSDDPLAPNTVVVDELYSYSPTEGSDVWDAWKAYHMEIGDRAVIVEDQPMPTWLDINFTNNLPIFSGTPRATGSYTIALHMEYNNNPMPQTYVSWTIIVNSANDGVEYSITFKAAGGIGEGPSSMNAPPNNVVILPGVSFSKDGHSMVAWSMQLDGTTVYYAIGSLYTVTQDAEFTAIYTANPNIIILDANGGSSNGELYGAYIAYTDDAIVLPSSGYSKNGYAFRGWYVSSDPNTIYAPGFMMTVSGEMVMKAYWIPLGTSTVSVTFNANGGTGSLSQVIESGKKVVLPTYGFNNSGKGLTGWTKDSTTGVKHDTDSKLTITSRTTMYAQWTESSSSNVVVSFNLNGGTGSINIQNLSAGDILIEPNVPTREGYIFSKWKVVGGVDWIFTNTVTTSMTLEAQWNQHFSITTKGTEVTLTMAQGYAGKSVSIYWSDGKVSSGMEGIYKHDYKQASSGKIIVTSRIDNVEYTSNLNYSVSPIDNGFNGNDNDNEDNNNTEDDNFWIKVIVTFVLAIIAAAICLIVRNPFIVLPAFIVIGAIIAVMWWLL